MIDIEKQKINFKDHVAKFTDYGNIKILDFQRPGSSEYRIRFLFQEDFYRLHISGDLGELTASNFRNMNYEDFIDDVLEDFDDEKGISLEGYRVLSDVDNNAWEYAGNIGRERTGIIELYLLAFKLAQEDLKRQESEVNHDTQYKT